MPVLESVAITLGASVSKAVVRCWIKSDFGEDLANDLIDKLATRMPDLFDRRRTSRQFQAMSDTVTKQILPLLHSEARSIPDNEIEAAVLAVSDTLGETRSLDFSTLADVDFEPTRLEVNLIDRTSPNVRGLLSEAGQYVYDRVLRESCNYVVELATTLPAFTSEALVEILRRETELSQKLEEALARLPQNDINVLNPDAEFDLRYRRTLARELDRLELFGITLDEGTRLYQLSVAYIALSVSTRDAESGEGSADGELESMGTIPVLAAASGPRDGDPSNKPTDQQVEAVLAQSPRHLVRGEAGSGKTTLLQWLAVTAARNMLPKSMASWQGATPVYLQLRRYANMPLPNPSQFLALSVPLLADLMPDGWMDRQLRAGDALLLIDGVDELPDAQRDEARNWLRSLLREYPDCRVVVTTRPAAVPSQWLDSDDFKISDLLPMSMADIANFVTHWYEAARQPVAHRREAVLQLREYEQRITRVIRDTPALRNLAATPLLCAMLCALYKDRRTQLPADRLALYRIALESLLERRDVERRISEHESVLLTLREKEILLEDMAYWLIRRGRSDVERQALLLRLQDRLSYMKSISATAEAVYKHLLVRSGLIREPIEGRVDFIHRTFQEYLAAARAVKEGDLEALVENAKNDQWRETIILAAGHASPPQANHLLSSLIAVGNQNAELRHRLHLLAAACLETALELDPAVRTQVEEALAGALPPTNMTEARAVASAGSLAAPLMTSTKNYATTAAACVRSLSLIGGEAAFSALETYAGERRLTVTRELLRAWDYFDKQQFAARVLSRLEVPDGVLYIDDLDILAAVHHLQGARDIHVQLSSLSLELTGIANAGRVMSLEASNVRQITSLGDLSGFTQMSYLIVRGSPSLERLGEALPPSLRSLTLSETPKLTDIGAVAECRALESLTVIEGAASNLASLRGHEALTMLRHQGNLSSDYSWIAETPALKSLYLGVSPYLFLGNSEPALEALRLESIDNGQLKHLHLNYPAGVADLASMPASLERLDMRRTSGLDLQRLPSLDSLEHLGLVGLDGVTGWSNLNTFGSLKSLQLSFCRDFSDSVILGELLQLKSLDLSGTGVTLISPLVALTELERLDVSDTAVSDLSYLEEFQAGLTVIVDPRQYATLSDKVKERHTVRSTRNPEWYVDAIARRHARPSSA